MDPAFRRSGNFNGATRHQPLAAKGWPADGDVNITAPVRLFDRSRAKRSSVVTWNMSSVCIIEFGDSRSSSGVVRRGHVVRAPYSRSTGFCLQSGSGHPVVQPPSSSGIINFSSSWRHFSVLRSESNEPTFLASLSQLFTSTRRMTCLMRGI